MKIEKIKVVLSWLPAVVVMVTIFYLSAQWSDESAQTSMGFLDWLDKVFNVNFNHEIIRETAHGCEYLGLCLMLPIGFLVTFKKQMPLATIIFASIYALSDEIHQIFVPGRAFQIIDILIDIAGAIIGTLVFFLIHLIITKLISKKKASD